MTKKINKLELAILSDVFATVASKILGPFQTSNFTSAASNANERKQ